METKIECAYVRDEQFVKEYISYHSYKRPAGIVITVACIVAIVSGLISIFAFHEYWNIITVALAIYLIVLRAIRVKQAIKISLQRDKESNHGSVVSIQNLVLENSIVIKSSMNESGTEYEMSCIDKAYRSKKYIYLITKAKLAIAFDVNGFTKGTPEELIEFLRQKGIKIK